MTTKLLLLPNDPYGMGIMESRNISGQQGFVYIIDFGEGQVKIGKSINPQDRITNIERIIGKTCINVKISPRCNNYSKIESYLHAKFSQQRIKGEWFKVAFEDACIALEGQSFDTEQVKATTASDSAEWEQYIRQLRNPLFPIQDEEPLSVGEFCMLNVLNCGENCPRFDKVQCILG